MWANVISYCSTLRLAANYTAESQPYSLLVSRYNMRLGVCIPRMEFIINVLLLTQLQVGLVTLVIDLRCSEKT